MIYLNAATTPAEFSVRMSKRLRDLGCSEPYIVDYSRDIREHTERGASDGYTTEWWKPGER